MNIKEKIAYLQHIERLMEVADDNMDWLCEDKINPDTGEILEEKVPPKSGDYNYTEYITWAALKRDLETLADIKK